MEVRLWRCLSKHDGAGEAALAAFVTGQAHSTWAALLALSRDCSKTHVVSDPNRFDRLTKRHRECLHGVRALQGSKEIADQLGIEKSTVDSYLTEAVRLLGARNRRHAALMLGDYEKPLQEQDDAHTPDKIRGDSARLVPRPAPLPFVRSPDELVVGQSDAGSQEPRSRFVGFGLPYRRKGQADNDLSVGDRLIWIQVIAVGSAIGFGMLAMGLQVVTTLIEGVTRHLS
jgi:DNA-binding CsgD family transcriptional regulator